MHLVTDGDGVPLNVVLTAGQVHESTAFEAVVGPIRVYRAGKRSRQRAARLAGDRADDAARIRTWLRQHGIQPVIPERRRIHRPRRGRPHRWNPDHYRGRNVVERGVGWLKEARSVATRYEKLAVNSLQMVKLAIMQRYLRLLTSVSAAG
ncbi:transposase [Roseiflexus castenholzii]|uniref:transposase n=1 Tax=Roseiflexus castenholzii TaxID=120962 RepID=UPI003C7A2397